MPTLLKGAARAKFFSTGRIQTLPVKVSSDGSVMIWDTVAGHYTRCHNLSIAAENRIARMVRKDREPIHVS